MPAPHARPSNNPLTLAEEVLDKLDRSPWACVVFLQKDKNEKLAVRCCPGKDKKAKTDESPQADKLRKDKWAVEVGTYTPAVLARDLVDDILCAMGEL